MQKINVTTNEKPIHSRVPIFRLFITTSECRALQKVVRKVGIAGRANSGDYAPDADFEAKNPGNREQN